MMNGSGTRSIVAGRDHLKAKQVVARETDPDFAALFLGDGSQGRRRLTIADADGCAGGLEGGPPVTMTVEGTEVCDLGLEGHTRGGIAPRRSLMTAACCVPVSHAPSPQPPSTNENSFTPRSASRELDGVAQLTQVLGHLLPVIALDLDDPVFRRPAGAAEPLQVPRQGSDSRPLSRQATDHRHHLAAPSSTLAKDANHAVIRHIRSGLLGRTGTLSRDLHAPAIGGIDKPTVAHKRAPLISRIPYPAT